MITSEECDWPWRIASIVAVTNGSPEACLQASACWRCAAGVRDSRGEPSRKSRILIAVKKSQRSAALKETRFAGSGNADSRYSIHSAPARVAALQRASNGLRAAALGEPSSAACHNSQVADVWRSISMLA